MINKFILFSFILILFSLTSWSFAAENYISLEGEEIEWGLEFLKVDKNFLLLYDGKTLTGEKLYLDLNKHYYLLDQVSLTACKKENKHYTIWAKQIKIYDQDRIVITDPEIKIGNFTFPIPFDLTLRYQNGRYVFPDWMPEISYSPKLGVGITLRGSKDFGSFRASGDLLLTTGGTLNLFIEGNKLLSSYTAVSGELRYDERFSGSIKVTGQYNPIGWQWLANFQDGAKPINELMVEYDKGGWYGRFDLKSQASELWPHFNLNFPQINGTNCNLKLTLDVSQITDASESRYGKIEAGLLTTMESKRDKHDWGLALEPGYIFIPYLGQGYELKSETWVNVRISSGLGFYAAYGRKDIKLTENISNVLDLTPEEYLTGELYYHYRNDLDEGWSLNVKSFYDIFEKRISDFDLEITRAFDCFDIETDINLIDPSFNMGIKLKY